MKQTALLAAALAAASLATPVAAVDDHGELAGATKAFHDLLSPNWHSDPGPARNAAACRNAGDYASLAEAIANQTAPSEGKDWAKATSGLRDASVALGAYCASGHEANVLAGLTTLHDRFHDLMKAMPKAK